MKISVEQAEGYGVLRPEGRLNMVAAPRLRSAIDRLLEDGSTRLVLDLADVSFMDSSGLGAVITGLKRARQAGGDLRLAAAGEQVQTVMRLTNLDRVLRPHATVQDAADGW
jgi:anti-sigma B factor antagonist